MRRIIALIAFACLSSINLVVAQEIWSLEQCVRYAQQNSLTIRQAQYGIQNARLTEKQNRFSRLPSLDASANYGYQFGRTIDPTTNSFDNQSIGFNSYSLNSGVTVFAGNQINNSIRQSRFEVQAAELEAQASANTIGLNVARAYLSILLSEEQLENAQKRLEQSRRQLDQTDRFIRAGTLAENERLSFLAQIALDEQAVVESQNAVVINYLTIKQLMEVDPNLDIRIQRPRIDVPTIANPDNFSANELYATALGTQPQIRAGDMRMQSADLGIALAKGAMLPSFTIFANLRTNFSSVARQLIGFGSERLSQTVFINGTPTTFEIENPVPIFGNNPYWDQLSQNFGQAIGVGLNIPIYSNHRNRIAVERARINVLNTEVNNRQLQQQLKADVQRAVADARAAKRSWEAAQRSVEAAQIAFDNAQKQFDLGAINGLQYATARNNLDLAQVSLIQAKYQYLFNLKVVDFYEGKDIRLD